MIEGRHSKERRDSQSVKHFYCRISDDVEEAVMLVSDMLRRLSMSLLRKRGKMRSCDDQGGGER